MLKLTFLLGFFLSFVLYLFIKPSIIWALPQTCIVNVADKDTGQPLQGADVKVFNGQPGNLTLVSEGETQTDGSYSFLTNGFGVGSLATNTLTFHKNGYDDATLAWSNNNTFSCPPPINQPLINSSVVVNQVYICTTSNQCATAVDINSLPAGTASYNDPGTCQANCTVPGAKWKIDGTPPNQRCIPDSNGTYNSQIKCEQANGIGTGTIPTGYDYIQTSGQCSPNSNTSCQPNPANGTCLSLEDCLKYKTSKTGATGSTGPTGKGTGAFCPEHKDDPNYIYTAIGCIPTNFSDLITAFSKLATGVGGGIALLLMISGAFRMITSAGNPDAVKAGHEQFTSAVIGLLFIIFAVLLLKVIGVDILNIPGFEQIPSPL